MVVGSFVFISDSKPTLLDLPVVPHSLIESTWSKRSVLLLGLGDSITAGYGASPGHSYFEMLAANPRNDAPAMAGLNLSKALPNLTKLNRSVSGSTSLHCLEQQIPKVDMQSPDVFGIVCITTGGNDLIHNYGRSPPMEHAMYGATWEMAEPWVKSYEQRLLQIVNAVESRFPGGCRIFIATIYDPTDGVGDIENAGGMDLPAWSDALRVLDSYNQVIKRIANKYPNIYLVDLHESFLGHGIHSRESAMKKYNQGDRSYWYFENLEDPNDFGYDAIRRLFLLEIASAFRDLK